MKPENVKPETWEAEMEGRVVALEGELAKAQTALAARNADVERLTAQVSKHESEAKARRDAQCQAFVNDLRKHGVTCGSPISEGDLSKVAAAFEKGHDGLAQDLGEAFRSRASALGGGQVREGAQTITLGGSESKEIDADMSDFRKRWGYTQQEA